MDLRGKRIEEGYTNLVTVEGDSVASSGKLQNGQGTDLGNIAVGGLSFNSGDSELQLPAGTTAERPASPSAGYARLNTDKGKVEIYTGAAWLSIALEGAVQLEAATATVTGQDAVAELAGFISQFGTPASAFSVRKLGSVTNAIRVRRSSDNAEQDIGFDGGDLDESALTNHVGTENLITYSEDFSQWSAGDGSFTETAIANPLDSENTASRIETTGSVTFINRAMTVPVNTQITVSMYVKYNNNQWFSFQVFSSGSTQKRAWFDVQNGLTGTTDNSTSSIEDIGSGWYRCSMTCTTTTNNNETLYLRMTSADNSETLPVGAITDFYGVQVVEGAQVQTYSTSGAGVSGDGFVTTWYDQSGNGNNATQATAGSQPKIVSSGTVIKENSVPALDFDGIDDELIAGDIFDGLTSFYTSSVFKFTDNGNNKGIHTEAPGGAGNRSFALLVDDSSPKKIFLVVETPSFSSVTESTSSSGQNVLITSTYNGSAIELFKDGSSQGTDANSGSITTNAGKFTIGARRAGVNNADVQFNEIIIYDSDKSSDRTDIESNINDYYGIY